MKKRVLLLCLGLMGVASPVMAAAERDSYRGGSFNLFFALLAFVFVMFLASYATRWIAGRFGGGTGRLLKVADSVFLGPNRGLHLVLLGKKLYLIGQADHSLNLLGELDDEELIAEAEKAFNARVVVPQGNFGQILQKLMKKEGEAELSAGTAERLLEQMNRMRRQKDRSGKNA